MFFIKISEAKVIKISICQLKILTYYLNAGYAILYPKGMNSEIQAVDKTNKLLSVMTVCRMPSIMVSWHIHELNSCRNFVVSVLLMEAIFPCFNLKTDDCNLAAMILVYKFSQLHKTLMLGKLWLGFRRFEWS